MTEVELPDGTILEFPDEMGRDQIKAAIDKQFGRKDSGRQVIATTDDGGSITELSDGSLAFSSPGFATNDQARIAQIMEGATPKEIVQSGVDQQWIAENPLTARGTKFFEGFPLTGSHMDELTGFFHGDKAADNFREASAAMGRERPKESLALNVTGAIAGSVPLALAGGPAIMASAPASLGSKALYAGGLGLAAGVTEGAIYGAGQQEGEGRKANAIEGAIIGGAAGGLLGAGAPYAAAGVRKVLVKLKGSGLATIKETLGVSSDAAKLIKAAIDTDDFEDAARQLARAGDDAMLVDAGQSGKALLDSASNMGGQAGRVARDAVEGRVSAASTKMKSVLDQTLGPVGDGSGALKRSIRDSTAQARNSAYEMAYSRPIDYSSSGGKTLEALMKRVPQSAIKTANDLMQIGGEESAQILARIGDDGKIVYETLPDVRQLDYLTRALQDVAEKADAKGKMGGITQKGGAIRNLSKAIRTALKREVPEYGRALDVASDTISRTKAVDFGGTLLRPGTTREAVKDSLAGASKAERKAMMEGVRTYIDDTMANVARTATDPNVEAREGIKLIRDLSSRASQSKMEMLLGRANASELAKELDQAAVAFELRAAIAQNSKTAIRQSIDGAYDEILSPGVLKHLGRGKAVNAVERVTQVLTGMTDEADQLRKMGIREEIARALTQTKGKEAERALALINLAMRQDAPSEALARRTANAIVSSGVLAGSHIASSSISTR